MSERTYKIWVYDRERREWSWEASTVWPPRRNVCRIHKNGGPGWYLHRNGVPERLKSGVTMCGNCLFGKCPHEPAQWQGKSSQKQKWFAFRRYGGDYYAHPYIWCRRKRFLSLDTFGQNCREWQEIEDINVEELIADLIANAVSLGSGEMNKENTEKGFWDWYWRIYKYVIIPIAIVIIIWTLILMSSGMIYSYAR